MSSNGDTVEATKVPKVLQDLLAAVKLDADSGDLSITERLVEAHDGLATMIEMAQVWAVANRLSGTPDDIFYAYSTILELGVRIGALRHEDMPNNQRG